MNPANTLKVSSVMFALLWAGWMIWSSGDFGAANIALHAVAGAIAGWLWFLGMRWFYRRSGLLPKA